MEETRLIGTHIDLEVGKVYQNRRITAYDEVYSVSFIVLRETDEQEYRKKFDFWDELPYHPEKPARFFEIRALD